MGVKRVEDLSPKAKRLYKTAKQYKIALSTYKRRRTSLQTRLRQAKKQMFVANSGLRSEAVRFCLQQLGRKNTKARGRRFSLEEKILCLAIYKASGAGYRYISRIFQLPSKRTLSRLLRKIPIKSGINHYLMDNLKETVRTLKSKEKLCTIIFDEISLMPHLEYNKIDDEIVGIENNQIMDHALVFMVRGITRKWKQTVCYSFCKGTTKSIDVKNMLMLTIKEIKKTGN